MSFCQRCRVKGGGFFFGVPLLREDAEIYDKNKKIVQIFKSLSKTIQIPYKDGLNLNRVFLIIGLAIAVIGLIIGTMAFTHHIHTFHLSRELAFSMMVSSAVSLVVVSLLLGIQKGVHDRFVKKNMKLIPIFDDLL